MSARSKALTRSIAVAGCLLALIAIRFPFAARAAWVNPGATQFQVGGQLRPITPTAVGALNPTCAGLTSLGGTSLAVVQSSKLAGVNPALGVVLVVSCLDTNATTQAQLNFLNPADGTVVKQISTTPTPTNGWAHLVLRPDKGDLLGCGTDGSIYSIHYSQFDTTAPCTTTSCTATPLPNPALGSCAALGWDPDEGMIYQGVNTGVEPIVGTVYHFKDGTNADPGNFPTLCGPSGTPGALSGVAVSGGVLLVACSGQSTVLRMDKHSGTILGVNGTLGVLGQAGQAAGISINPGLSDLACDPVTFNPIGNDTFTDGIWTRNGANGNGVVALEFPAFTCGMPPKSVVSNLSPLAAGLSAKDGLGKIGAVPNPTCFDGTGKVINAAGDGLPDCWKPNGPSPNGIDFDGDGSTDLQLTVQVNTNGDGVTLTGEPASVSQKDLFVEIDWMVNHKPDPQAFSQGGTQSVAAVGVKSVREAFLAAPVPTPVNPQGVHIHLQVMPSPVFLNTFADAPGTVPSQKEVTELVMTPCTPPAINPATNVQNVKSLSDAADFDAIKKLNFGSDQATVNAMNAKRLAFRYVLFAHNQTGTGGAGSTASGCSSLPGPDAAITLGSFAATSVSPCNAPACTVATHNRGTTDQQAGTLMHELGHTLGLRHGGGDNVNCKPNYLSVMSYTRQIAGSPIPNRRLDYSRAQLPPLNEASLLEPNGLCLSSLSSSCDPSLSTITNPLSAMPYYPTDQTTFGPTAWTMVSPATGLDGTVCPLPNGSCLNWNRSKTNKGVPTIDANPVSAALTSGPGGCTDLAITTLNGHDDWHNLLYRASAALEFAGGFPAPSEHISVTQEGLDSFFLASDVDSNGVGDGQDCGTGANGTTLPTSPLCPPHQTQLNPNGPLCGTGFCSTHRINIQPDAPIDSFGAKIISLSAYCCNMKIAIFSEPSPTVKKPVPGNGLWDATTEVVLLDSGSLSCSPDCLPTLTVESLEFPVKVNQFGQGTCSAQDVADPITGKKDGFRDLACQFPFKVNQIPLGRHEGIVSGWFMDPSDPESPSNCLSNNNCVVKAFRAREAFVAVP